MGQLAYKGFDKKLRCRGFQFEIGGTYEEKKAELCACGFHACLRPLDVFRHYPASDSRYCLVELDDVCEERSDSDTKVCARKIRVIKELSVSDIIAEQERYDDAFGLRAIGNNDLAIVNSHKAAMVDDCGIASAGPGGMAATGARGVAIAGIRGVAAAGERGLAISGDRGTAISRGGSATGIDGVAVARGNSVMACGKLGAIIVLVEEKYTSFAVAECKVGVVDGITLKPDTWYKLKNGEFVEAKDEENEDE